MICGREEAGQVQQVIAPIFLFIHFLVIMSFEWQDLDWQEGREYFVPAVHVKNRLKTGQD